jgi:hypothetical protein
MWDRLLYLIAPFMPGKVLPIGRRIGDQNLCLVQTEMTMGAVTWGDLACINPTLIAVHILPSL